MFSRIILSNWVIAVAILGMSFSPAIMAGEFMDDFSKSLAAENWENASEIRGIENFKFVSQFDQSSLNAKRPRNRLETANISALTQVTSIISVIDAAGATNSDNAANGVFARIEGYFYNASANNGPDDVTGLVWAAVFIGNRGAGLEAWWRWEKSKNADFSDTDDRTGIFAGITPTISTEYTVQIVYDENKTFTFTIDDGKGTKVDVVIDGPDRVDTAALERARLTTGADFANGGDGTASFVRATFDDVIIVYNNGASNFTDSFSDEGFNSVNWRNRRNASTHITRVPDVSEGGLVMTVQSELPPTQDRYTVNSSVADPTQNCLYTEATWDASTFFEPSMYQGKVRVMGYWYNDTGPPYLGSDGNVFASVRIQSTSSGGLEATWGVFQEPAGALTNDGGVFKTIPVPDISYPMFVEFDKPGKKMLFHFAGETKIFNIPTMIYDPAPGTVFNALQVRIQQDTDPTPEGYVRANFAKVFSGDKCPVTDDNFLLEVMPAILGGIK